jgi:hypothetical protein
MKPVHTVTSVLILFSCPRLQNLFGSNVPLSLTNFSVRGRASEQTPHFFMVWRFGDVTQINYTSPTAHGRRLVGCGPVQRDWPLSPRDEQSSHDGHYRRRSRARDSFGHWVERGVWGWHKASVGLSVQLQMAGDSDNGVRTLFHERACGATDRSAKKANRFPRACLWRFCDLSSNPLSLVQFQFWHGVRREAPLLVLQHKLPFLCYSTSCPSCVTAQAALLVLHNKLPFLCYSTSCPSCVTAQVVLPVLQHKLPFLCCSTSCPSCVT